MFHCVYRSFTYAAWPFLRVLPALRLSKGKEIKHRIPERFGYTHHKRPAGDVLWIHAASNGEALSALPLIDYFQSIENSPHIVMTTMTVTAANLIQKRTNPQSVTHQFIPYDHPTWVARFHDHWKPNMVVWTESELWPNHLTEIRKRNIPCLLANARLSDKSLKSWSKFNETFKKMISTFDTILAQTDRDKDNITALGIDNVQVKGNLKDYAPALPFDEHATDDIRDIIETRPTILYASTHDPEETIAIDIHTQLKKNFPNALTIIVPRHPHRGERIAADHNNGEFTIARRALKMSPRTDTDIYIADTLGELGLFYHLCPIVFVGNSLGTKPGGGHNLLEPAWHNCAIISGDDLHNFSTQAKEMPEANACTIINNQNELHDVVNNLLNDPDATSHMANNALDYVTTKQSTGMTPIIDALKPTCQKAGIL